VSASTVTDWRVAFGNDEEEASSLLCRAFVEHLQQLGGQPGLKTTYIYIDGSVWSLEEKFLQWYSAETADVVLSSFCFLCFLYGYFALDLTCNGCTIDLSDVSLSAAPSTLHGSSLIQACAIFVPGSVASLIGAVQNLDSLEIRRSDAHRT
jgi:hypothetical protein